MNAFSKAATVLVALALLGGYARAMDTKGQEQRGPDAAAVAAERVAAAAAVAAEHAARLAQDEDEMRELNLRPAKRIEALGVPRRAAEQATVPMPEPPPVPLILVPAKELDPERADALVEDMEIMSHILQGALREALGEEHVPRATYGPFTPLFDGERRQCLYLDGYGALFLLKVRPALVGSVPGGPEAPREQESRWERAKQELRRPAQTFSPAAPYMMRGPMEPARPEAEVQVARPGAPPPLRYPSRRAASAGVVRPGAGRIAGPPPARRTTRRVPTAPTADMVRDALLEVLKEASNMRLESDESIAVVVTGGAATAYTGFGFGGPGGGAFGTPRAAGFRGNAGEGTVLTIHVKKRDVDAFAEGELGPEEFRERATIVLR